MSPRPAPPRLRKPEPLETRLPMTDLKSLAHEIFDQTVAAVDARRAICTAIERQGSRLVIEGGEVDLAEFASLRVVAFGKAAAAMAEGLAEVLAPEYKAEGILVVPSLPPRLLPGWKLFVAGHPMPNEESFAAARAIFDLLGRANGRTLVFFLLSGGGSALVELPLDPAVSLDDMRELHRVLVTCGGSIDEINFVRKHLSAVKGGRLAAAAPKAMKLTLAITDVPAGRESALASGPTLPDPSTIDDAYRVIEKYGLLDRLPASLRPAFAERKLAETPKPGDPAFARSRFVLVLDHHRLFHQAHRAAESRGFATICDNSTDDWPLDRAADFLLDLLARHKQANPDRPVAVIADGEVLCRVTGDGMGGRNSAFALYAVQKIAGRPIAVLSAGTDGIDGSSPAAGAVADRTTLDRARAAGLDPDDFARRSDSYTFFARLGDAIHTGPTGNNLRDLRILLHE
jgi:glycerate 2-kinase